MITQQQTNKSSQKKRRIQAAGNFFRDKMVLPRTNYQQVEQKDEHSHERMSKLPPPIFSRLPDSQKIKLSNIGPLQIFGDDDCLLKRNYTCSLRCVKRGSQAYLMQREDFLRIFKGNEDAWDSMFKAASKKESQLYDRCQNFVSCANEDSHKMSYEQKKRG